MNVTVPTRTHEHPAANPAHAFLTAATSDSNTAFNARDRVTNPRNATGSADVFPFADPSAVRRRSLDANAADTVGGATATADGSGSVSALSACTSPVGSAARSLTR
ncbi:hypothetical protein [Leifsonia sp. Le1]|uniref:hypothetical protein n=1 Tax=Leifsonia sp. Le1 TaxID=3404918 RepID=UPI003EBFC2DC